MGFHQLWTKLVAYLLGKVGTSEDFGFDKWH